MKLKVQLQLTAILAVAVVMTAASATGATIYFNTNAAGTEYTPSDSLVLHNSSGVSATLTFTPNGTSNVGVPPPSEVDLGHFDLRTLDVFYDGDRHRLDLRLFHD